MRLKLYIFIFCCVFLNSSWTHLFSETTGKESNSHTSYATTENQTGLSRMQTYKEVTMKERQVIRLNEEYKQQKLILSFFIALTLLMFALTLIVYHKYRIKKRTNYELKMEMNLLDQQRLESIGRLAGGIAHDFNNLLSVIIGNIHIAAVKLGGQQKPEVAEYLDRAVTASSQAADLTQKFVIFSEEGWLVKSKITLPLLFQDTTEHFKDLKKCQYTFSFHENISDIYGDEQQIKVVIINLLMNARDAMPQKNKMVTVVGENVRIDRNNHLLLAPGNYIKVSVTDNGTGIPSDHLKKIFDPYFTTKSTSNKKGLGLGLALCYSIMKKHDGCITATSIVGVGSAFNLYFPAIGKMEIVPPVPPHGNDPIALTA